MTVTQLIRRFVGREFERRYGHPTGNNQSAVYRDWVSEAIHNKHVLYLSIYLSLDSSKFKLLP